MEDKFQETQFKNKNNQDYSDEESDEDNPKSELQLTIEKQLSQKLWQLCNWNVTGFNFDFGGQRTIRAPDVVFKQFAIWMCYRIGPFKGNYSPIKVTNVMFKKPGFLIDIDRNMRVLYSWRWYRKNTVLYYEHDWENINTRVSDRDSYRLR
uniref:Uncharacterized protein n=1 Tax=Rhizophagus irregularis (strain DAOM 181602 / DAOM 197198 / MUCL 43194) TaxID=747089 RepID=U9STA9_RHIID